jgi:hypothetical protein
MKQVRTMRYKEVICQVLSTPFSLQLESCLKYSPKLEGDQAGTWKVPDTKDDQQLRPKNLW